MDSLVVEKEYCDDWAHWICQGCGCLCHYGKQRIEEAKVRLGIKK